MLEMRDDGRVAKGRAGFLTLVALLVMLLVVVVLFSVAIGAILISPGAILGALFGHGTLTATQEIILLQIRLPRVLASAVIGAALAISGLMFQGLFRNPMADPYVIGSSGGAVLGACVGIFFFSQFSLFGFSATALLAFAGLGRHDGDCLFSCADERPNERDHFAAGRVCDQHDARLFELLL